jgi:hypothetical protein
MQLGGRSKMVVNVDLMFRTWGHLSLDSTAAIFDVDG